MHDLLPQIFGTDGLLHVRIVTVHWELLHIQLIIDGCLHELIIDLHTDVGTRHLTLGHLSVDESFTVGMLDTHGEHQRTASAVLRHLTGTVAVTLHERNESGGCQCGVVHRGSLRTDMRQVMPHTATAFHQLHLLLIDSEDSSITVGITVESDHEAVAQRRHLEVVADTGHRTTCRYDISEMIQE